MISMPVFFYRRAFLLSTELNAAGKSIFRMQVSRKSEKRYTFLSLFCFFYSFRSVMYIESWFVQPTANFRLEHTYLLYRLATSLPWISWPLVLFHFSISMTKRCDYADCDIGEDIISPFFSLSMLFSILSFFPFSARYFTFYIFYHLRTFAEVAINDFQSF